MKFSLLLSFCLLATTPFFAQTNSDKEIDPKTEKVYRVKPLLTGGLGLGGMIVGSLGIERLRDKPFVTDNELQALTREDVPGFDRWGLDQDLDKREDAEHASDLVFNGAVLLPLTLFVSKKFRKDWLDITSMYIATHALNSTTYGFGPFGAGVVDRIRPIAYYPDADYGLRSQGNARNSFFSGHVSTTAVGTFFFTKVLSDYNPQWTGWQRALAFGAAAIPPLYVAVQRVRALKHFPSDTAVGFAVGAFFGVMTPQVHKNWQRKHRTKLSIGGGYSGGVGNGGFVLTF